MLKFLHWLVTSSENPSNISLTLKGAIPTIISIILLVAPIFHVSVDSSQLTQIGDGVMQAVLAFCGFVSAVAMVVGLIRKIHLSGKNPVALQTATPSLTISPAV